MKFFNLRKKLRNSTLAVLFALAVMFVMPATAFADDTDIIDNDTAVNVEVENGIDENSDNIDSTDSTLGFDTELPAVTEDEDSVDYTENTEPENPFIPSDNCYGICCAACDENCNGTCCDMCTIINVNVPDNSEYDFGDEFAGTDLPDNVDNETDDTSKEEENLSDPDDEIIVDHTDEFTNSNDNENIMPVDPNKPIFPDDYYNNIVIPENPEDNYQPEVDNSSTDDDLIGDTDEDNDDENEEEIIYDDDFTDEEEIISDDEDLEDDENSETSDDSDSEPDEEDSDNPGEEDEDNSTDDENNDDSDIEDSDNAGDEDDSDNSDNENSDNITDEENPDDSDSENSDNITDENDSDDAADEENNDSSDEENSDNTADEENPDDSDSEALEEDDNPIISVVLPVSISVVINPYNLKVVDESGFHYSISSPEYSIKNYSNCAVSIVATTSASADGGMVISPYDLTGNETEFTAFAYIEATNESNVYSDTYNNSDNQLVFSCEAVSKEILTLADGSNGETTGYFKIVGRAVLPEGVQYSSQAMLNMVITFDIEPIGKSVNSDDAAEETEDLENTENSENVEDIENAENNEDIENVENVENTESVENNENTENVEDSENVENNENTENVENTENEGNVEGSENTENSENFQEFAA